MKRNILSRCGVEVDSEASLIAVCDGVSHRSTFAKVDVHSRGFRERFGITDSCFECFCWNGNDARCIGVDFDWALEPS